MNAIIFQIIIGSAVLIGGVLYSIHVIRDYRKSAEEFDAIQVDHSKQWYAELYNEINKKYTDKINRS